MSIKNQKRNDETQHQASVTRDKYTPIYICFFDDEDLPIGWVKTAEEAVEWAQRVHCGYKHGAVKIVKSYEIKR